MENKFNIQLKSEVMQDQAEFLFNRAYDLLGDTATPEEVSSLVAETIRRYYMDLGSPLLVKRYAERDHLPWIEDYNDSVIEITEDVSILYKDTENMANYLSEYFNYAQSEKDRLMQRIRGVSGLTSDLNLIANDSTSNSTYFRESFDDTKGFESSMVVGTPAQIATQEGVITLARKDTVNRSINAKVKSIQGNGEAGTYHIVRKSMITSDSGTQTIANYISDSIPNDKPAAILDGRPDTIFEYQMINIDADVISGTPKGYDFEWAKGTKANDKLRAKIIIELDELVDVNWISINPYHPAYSTGKVTVYSIRTSEDGFDYQSLYEGGSYVLNSQLNLTPQTYRQDAIFDGSNNFADAKFAGQGVWAFPTRQAKYVEVVMDQNESYQELIGHTYYEKVTKTQDSSGEVTKTVRIPKSEAPKNAVDGVLGTYTLDSGANIVKGIEYKEFEGHGWRYVIGIRDINIMSYQFQEKSEFISKKYETTDEIKEIMLYVNEKIPQSYLDVVSTGNDWIQYFISIDDVNWVQISPMHHQPLDSSKDFPSKIIQFNGNKTDLAAAFQLHKTYMDTDKPVKGVRLKVIMQRPTKIDNAETTTPVLEDYALRVVFADEGVNN